MVSFVVSGVFQSRLHTLLTKKGDHPRIIPVTPELFISYLISFKKERMISGYIHVFGIFLSLFLCLCLFFVIVPLQKNNKVKLSSKLTPKPISAFYNSKPIFPTPHILYYFLQSSLYILGVSLNFRYTLLLLNCPT